MKMSIVQISLFIETIELYIFQKCICLAGKLGRKKYLYKERDRERVVLVDQKKDIQCGVCRNKETHTLYE